MSGELYVVHAVSVIGAAGDDHLFLGDLTGSNMIGNLSPEDEVDNDFAAVVLLLDMIRDLPADKVLVLRKEDAS